jgi:hypothetical protein
MSLTATTLSAACGANDGSINVTAATGFVAKNLIRVDDELMRVLVVDGTRVDVARGLRGTRAVAHNALAFAVTGLTTDFSQLQAIGPLAPLPRTYTLGSGAQNVPIAPGLFFLMGTTGSTTDLYTLANPDANEDGLVMCFMARAAHAYRVTNVSGFNVGGSSLDLATFGGAIGDNFIVVASNGYWNVIGVKNVTLG